MQFEQEQFTRLKCLELRAPARLPEIHFLDARQPRQLIDAFAGYSKILIIARFVRISFEAQCLKIGQVILVTEFSWNDMVNLDRSLIC